MIKKLSLRLSAAAVALMIALFSTALCFAEVTQQYAIEDDAAIFTDDQLDSLRDKLSEGNERTGWQLILHTSSLGITSELNNYYNKNYYDQKSFAADAVVLVFDLGSNKGTVISHGEAMDYISDQRMSSLGSMLRSYMDNGDYYGATFAFVDTLEQYHSDGIPTGDTFDNITYEQKTNKFLYVLKHYGIIIGIAAIAVGVIMFFVIKSKYKHMGVSGTYDLAANSSVNLSDVEYQFVNQYTTVRTIKDDSDSGSSGGSSGGSTHGGGDF